MRRFVPLLAVALIALAQGVMGAAAAPLYVSVPGGPFESVLADRDGAPQKISLAPFAMRATPVTVAEFAAFTRAHPQWRRGAVPGLLADGGYLAHSAVPTAPVTEVSWFAARAFCASEQAELPTWSQWEMAAAADATRADARRDPARAADILATITAATGQTPGPVGRRPANLYGLHDMNRLIWEWVADYAALFVNADAREAGSGPSLALCGGSALAFFDRDQYAVLMRVAALTTLKPVNTSPHVGFRCVRNTGDTR